MATIRRTLTGTVEDAPPGDYHWMAFLPVGKDWDPGYPWAYGTMLSVPVPEESGAYTFKFYLNDSFVVEVESAPIEVVNV
jgi:hypothetical protein